MTGAARDHGATIVVSALASAFSVALILLTSVMSAAMDAQGLEGGTFRVLLLIVSGLFILIALYVGAIVTANTFATVIAGRTRQIALLRLLGATSSKVRARVAIEGLFAGAVGATIGLVIAVGLVAFVALAGPGFGWLPRGEYPLFDPLALVAVVVVVATTWIAAWSGSRRVAGVSPIAATGAAVEQNQEESRSRRSRSVWALILMILGAAILAVGVYLGMVTALGLVVAFFGGLISFTGIAIGAHLVMPPVLRLAGRALGSGPATRIAVANAERYPERTSRSAIGLVIGVTLVTMFSVALATYEQMTLAIFADEPDVAAEYTSALAITSLICTVLVGFSAVIASVGMVNTLSLGVLQRTRELGLLRTLGFTGRQVRGMVVAESAQITLAALGLGLVLGIVYGWAAAQSLLGEQVGLVGPTIPWPVLLGVILFGIVLAIGASVAPSRRAVRIAPVSALAAD
ncbi:ABC transporter permease [Leucobacter sp. CSA2]|uniref:ABC transporter permease n=1 Tax=Leucobacter edaphi TaxID=2796472 RepID=A0A934QA35_9MICO|nr:ABC transporter permease [Leucobacter edaphi]MBK0420578.1 ABC transporter permease [Leucobacter edaphi]